MVHCIPCVHAGIRFDFDGCGGGGARADTLPWHVSWGRFSLAGVLHVVDCCHIEMKGAFMVHKIVCVLTKASVCNIVFVLCMLGTFARQANFCGKGSNTQEEDRVTSTLPCHNDS